MPRQELVSCQQAQQARAAVQQAMGQDQPGQLDGRRRRAHARHREEHPEVAGGEHDGRDCGVATGWPQSPDRRRSSAYDASGANAAQGRETHDATLHHITLSTGHHRHSSRGEVLAALTPLLDQGPARRAGGDPERRPGARPSPGISLRAGSGNAAGKPTAWESLERAPPIGHASAAKVQEGRLFILRAVQPRHGLSSFRRGE